MRYLSIRRPTAGSGVSNISKLEEAFKAAMKEKSEPDAPGNADTISTQAPKLKPKLSPSEKVKKFSI